VVVRRRVRPDPYYPCDEDVLHWHRTAREACAPFGPEVYGQYKAWCDRYFFLPHREETRGVGGLFFDDLAEGGFARCFDFLRSVGDSFLPATCRSSSGGATNPGASGNAAFSFTGAAAMSNSIYCTTAAPCSDFSPKAAPNQSDVHAPLARWDYDWHATPGSPEARLYEGTSSRAIFSRSSARRDRRPVSAREDPR